MTDKNEYQREWRKKNKEKTKKYSKKYYEKNKEKIIENNKEYNKEYYEKNKEKIIEYNKQYYEKNKEKLKKFQKENYETKKEKIKKNNKNYYEENKERLKEYQQKRYNKITNKENNKNDYKKIFQKIKENNLTYNDLSPEEKHKLVLYRIEYLDLEILNNEYEYVNIYIPCKLCEYLDIIGKENNLNPKGKSYYKLIIDEIINSFKDHDFIIIKDPNIKELYYIRNIYQEIINSDYSKAKKRSVTISKEIFSKIVDLKPLIKIEKKNNILVYLILNYIKRNNTLFKNNI